MGQIKLKIDIRSGVIDVETDDSTFSSVMDRAEILLDKFANIETGHGSDTNSSEDSRPIDTAGSSVDPKAANAPEKKRRRSGGAGKTASWKMVDNLLEEAQRKQLKEFYSQKGAANQNEQVAVLAFKLNELTKREAFSGDEIHTAFQTVGVKTPKNLMAVFGNMTADGLGNMADKKFRPNFKCGDLVKHDLPRKKAKK